MQPLVSVIMGSTSDLPIMQRAAKQLEALEIPFELLALSAHRTPDEVAEFARGAEERGVRVVIAAAGMAAHLCGVIASMTPLPVIGVPIDASLEGLDALLAIVQMPPGIPVATVGVNAAQNAALLAAQMLALGDPEIAQRVRAQKASLKEKIVKANKELAQISDYKYKTN
ncbi:5-(carboxyamino)imidazole ribonucleotide mutase [uncultured Porphyromonas sp.]|uniref:5-(carboxyamino)imidazole ribonucleotide mutase n=1 Tax=uncultured Porphyromonas sp. TaxID=159274 RepID=UPI0026264FCF|nr:5-(carboxyamino)imidazole ribonucleotide mutase [uncultured Porphyromonas sp.]